VNVAIEHVHQTIGNVRRFVSAHTDLTIHEEDPWSGVFLTATGFSTRSIAQAAASQATPMQFMFVCDARCKMQDARCKMQDSTFNIQHSTFNINLIGSTSEITNKNYVN
jgi:hypothetical protein